MHNENKFILFSILMMFDEKSSSDLSALYGSVFHRSTNVHQAMFKIDKCKRLVGTYTHNIMKYPWFNSHDIGSHNGFRYMLITGQLEFIVE